MIIGLLIGTFVGLLMAYAYSMIVEVITKHKTSAKALEDAAIPDTYRVVLDGFSGYEAQYFSSGSWSSISSSGYSFGTNTFRELEDAKKLCIKHYKAQGQNPVAWTPRPQQIAEYEIGSWRN